jgi:hypothetical protein
MKKQIILSGIIAIASLGFGQTGSWSSTGTGNNLWNNPLSGNVGIGTALPDEKLHIIGGIRSYKNGLDAFSAHLYLANQSNDRAFNFQLNSNSSSPASLNLWTFKTGPGWSKKFTFTADGALGIGTVTPIDQLHVIGGIRSYKDGSSAINPQLYLGNSGNNRAYNLQLNSSGNGLDLWTFNGSSWINRYTFLASGAMGIGKTTPNAYLNILAPDGGPGFIIEHNTTDPVNTQINYVRNNNSTAFWIINNAQVPAKTVFKITGTGATYIGDKQPLASGNHSDAQLSVYGKILAKSVYVNTDPSVWSDYVFEKEYKLMSLEEVEKYYTYNKHLPGVPSAKEVEENGDNLVETDAILLKKIEELTLYIVAMQKEINNLKKQNN